MARCLKLSRYGQGSYIRLFGGVYTVLVTRASCHISEVASATLGTKYNDTLVTLDDKPFFIGFQ
jgi:hypothetical protein